MIKSDTIPPIGILGLGFLGQTLAREFTGVPECWGTWHKTPPPETPLKNFHFDWGSENSWTALRHAPETLVLTIPPLLKNQDDEEKRLCQWGEWMNLNRPMIKRMIYISSTGVYPKRNGIWYEDSEFEPDTNSGKLRLNRHASQIRKKYCFLQNSCSPYSRERPGTDCLLSCQ